MKKYPTQKCPTCGQLTPVDKINPECVVDVYALRKQVIEELEEALSDLPICCDGACDWQKYYCSDVYNALNSILEKKDAKNN